MVLAAKSQKVKDFSSVVEFADDNLKVRMRVHLGLPDFLRSSVDVGMKPSRQILQAVPELVSESLEAMEASDEGIHLWNELVTRREFLERAA
jgi:hypothetical protein